MRWTFGGIFALALAGCSAPNIEPQSENHIDSLVEGERSLELDSVVGTYDVVTEGVNEAPEFRRMILLNDGTGLTCPFASPACRPGGALGGSAASPIPLRSYRLVQTKQGVVLAMGPHVPVETRQSPVEHGTTERRYVVEHMPSPEDGSLVVHELTGDAPQVRLVFRRLPCSEQLYQDDAEKACAYYECKLATAKSAEARCAYFDGYGLPYCRKFSEANFEDPSFAPRVRACLQEAIRDTMEGDSCEVVEEKAFASHVGCYVDGGFCSLSLADRLTILQTIEPKDLDGRSAVTFAKIQQRCLETGT